MADLGKIRFKMPATKEILIGQRFHHLVVVAKGESDSRGATYWVCTCDCGGSKTVVHNKLISGHTKSCGCKARRGAIDDLTGQRFGRLTVQSIQRNGRRVCWKCICDCGRTAVSRSDTLKSGKSQSCGCLHTEKVVAAHKTHGMTGTKIYGIWHSMRDRCLNPSHPAYESYGGRGITICERWSDFQNFYNDMGDAPKGMSIDRIDNNKGYSPDNCRWADSEIQNNNKRTVPLYEFRGQKLGVAQWAKVTGISANVVFARFRLGWSPEMALFTPVEPRRPRRTR